jgi:hypothetical protein
MRTAAFQVRSQLLDFLKTEPNLDFLKTEKNTCHCPFKQQPHQARILSGYSQEKNLGSAPILCPIRSVKNIDTSRPRPKASHLGRTPGDKKKVLPFCHWGDMAVILKSYFTTLERNRWRRRINNCAVALTRTVKVLRWLIIEATEGAGWTTG